MMEETAEEKQQVHGGDAVILALFCLLLGFLCGCAATVLYVTVT